MRLSVGFVVSEWEIFCLSSLFFRSEFFFCPQEKQLSMERKARDKEIKQIIVKYAWKEAESKVWRVQNIHSVHSWVFEKHDKWLDNTARNIRNMWSFSKTKELLDDGNKISSYRKRGKSWKYFCLIINIK